jgi:hypothetical protein
MYCPRNPQRLLLNGLTPLCRCFEYDPATLRRCFVSLAAAGWSKLRQRSAAASLRSQRLVGASRQRSAAASLRSQRLVESKLRQRSAAASLRSQRLVGASRQRSAAASLRSQRLVGASRQRSAAASLRSQRLVGASRQHSASLHPGKISRKIPDYSGQLV